jgi:hypothetical protein
VPRPGDSVSVKQPQKPRDEQQNGLIDGSRERQQAEYGKPAQGPRDLTVAGQKPDSPDYSSRALQAEETMPRAEQPALGHEPR